MLGPRGLLLGAGASLWKTGFMEGFGLFRVAKLKHQKSENDREQDETSPEAASTHKKQLCLEM